MLLSTREGGKKVKRETEGKKIISVAAKGLDPVSIRVGRSGNEQDGAE